MHTNYFLPFRLRFFFFYSFFVFCILNRFHLISNIVPFTLNYFTRDDKKKKREKSKSFPNVGGKMKQNNNKKVKIYLKNRLFRFFHSLDFSSCKIGREKNRTFSLFLSEILNTLNAEKK